MKSKIDRINQGAMGMSVMQTENKQLALPLFEDLVCTFQCVAHCPFPNDCIKSDPDIGMFDLVEYPQFFFWRIDNEHLVRPEPKDPLQTRCKRCFSIKVEIGYPHIVCGNCGYEEELIDFPISQDWHEYYREVHQIQKVKRDHEQT